MGNLSRRDFLKLSGVTGAGLGAASVLAAWLAAEPPETTGA